jgi:transcription elongation factor Elf1
MLPGTGDYKISEYLRGGCVRCPFCGDYGLDRGVVDETQPGKMRQRITCWNCGKGWTVEYDASRVLYEGRVISIFDHWPTPLDKKMEEEEIEITPRPDKGEPFPFAPKKKSILRMFIEHSKKLDW